MTTDSSLTLTLVLYPSTPRNVTLHLKYEEESDAHLNDTPPQNSEPGDSDTDEISPATVDEAVPTESPEKKRRGRKPRNSTEASSVDEGQQNPVTSGVPDVSRGATSTEHPVDPVTPGTVKEINPDKDKPLPDGPVSPEHGEPKSPENPPFESPRTTDARGELQPYNHANPEHRRSLMHTINQVSGMAFTVWKNTPVVYDAVKKFQAEIEGKPALLIDQKLGAMALDPSISERLAEILKPALAETEDTY